MLTRDSIREQFESRIHRGPVAWAGGAVIRNWREIADYLPGPGENTLLVTQKQFSSFEFVPILLDGLCERLLIATFNMSGQAVGMLEMLLDEGQVCLADILVSEAMRRLSDGGAVIEQLEGLAREFQGRVRFRALDIHAKLIGIATEGGDFWVVEGSGNMSRNTHIELYSLFNDRDRYAFHSRWIGGVV